MKETVNVNIGSQAFLDEDAYRVLRSYLDDIRHRPPARIRHRNHRGTHCRDIPRDRLLSDARHHPRHGAHGDASEWGTLGLRRAPRQHRPAGGRGSREPKPASSTTRAPTARSPASAEGWADFFHVDATVIGSLHAVPIIFGGLSIHIILWIIIPEQPAPEIQL